MYLLVMNRGEFTPPGWTRVPDAHVDWSTADGKSFRDRVYRRQQQAGELSIPAHPGHDGQGWYGIPHAVVVVED